ncbi:MULTISPECIES: AbrB/MazE/SpoVT family DNA-binding domain-containing protein [Hyphomicrobiales]|uniref:Looped-hinge helix DNA binding domain-containing protein, AbrB family n=2 Tax=Hyphomicrobiales TaxID=356 RepID=A0A1G5P5G8_AFIMA|nr:MULTISPECIES: AbrB/MazE/SpoVT family DNA-binding domain-containing protein [Hyphomicrobiales]MBK1625071.1 hypothetical protein [Afifella marina DSM 2698]MBK1628775.1 hypothetical protein [Afifella marina]MBK5918433.1 hypothetical protein [Afifella marina]MCT8268105.1 AbrB/MazE/SpoVT family DNA-binding domain-containing protein [Afifella sp. JA880]MDQ0326053.1 AbrB family looped-hinge helix DNA binding protein [Rhodopseudomonas julia]
MRMTSKGQVTVPKHLRDLAGLRPGSEVRFSFEEGRVTLSRADAEERPGKTRGDRAVEAIVGTRTVNRGLSTDEIMRLMRGDA